MPAFTIQSLVDRAASIADMHDQFVRPSEWLAWANFERRALAADMARHNASLVNSTAESFVAPDEVTLSIEPMAIVGVWLKRPDGRLRQLRIVPFVDMFFQQVGGPVTGASEIVSIKENADATTDSSTSLKFYPRDTSPTNTYIVVSIISPEVVTSMGDSFFLPMGLEERIVLGMAKRALIKEESDLAAVNDLIREADKVVEEYGWSRSFAQVPAVRNTDALNRGWDGAGALIFPPPDTWAWL